MIFLLKRKLKKNFNHFLILLIITRRGREFMNILAVSVLFARGTNIYTQLQCIVKCKFKHDELQEYVTLYNTMKKIYSSDNTKANRDRLQEFILKYGNQIQEKYVSLCVEDGAYSLKRDS